MIEIKQQEYYIEASYGDIATMWGWADDAFIHLIRGDVKEGYKRRGIMTKLIKSVRQKYPHAELSFQGLSEEGRKFVLSSFPNAIVRPSEKRKYYKITVEEYIKTLNK